MTSGDVFAANKKRLAQFSASKLEDLEIDQPPQEHTCLGSGITSEDATLMDSACSTEVQLTDNEECSAAYVAGWLEKKCTENLGFTEDDELVGGEVRDFIEEVSRGKLTVPHTSTYEIVRLGLNFVKTV